MRSPTPGISPATDAGASDCSRYRFTRRPIASPRKDFWDASYTARDCRGAHRGLHARGARRAGSRADLCLSPGAKKVPPPVPPAGDRRRRAAPAVAGLRPAAASRPRLLLDAGLLGLEQRRLLLGARCLGGAAPARSCCGRRATGCSSAGSMSSGAATGRPQVGFYGGVNYGFGYDGVDTTADAGKAESFFYNTAVNNIRVTQVTNVYNAPVVVNNVTTINRVSFNGGMGGVVAAPTPQQLSAASEPHIPPTPLQRNHVRAASVQPQQFLNTNQGKPAVAATPRPGAFNAKEAVPAKAAGSAPAVPQPVPNAQPPAPNVAPTGEQRQPRGHEAARRRNGSCGPAAACIRAGRCAAEAGACAEASAPAAACAGRRAAEARACAEAAPAACARAGRCAAETRACAEAPAPTPPAGPRPQLAAVAWRRRGRSLLHPNPHRSLRRGRSPRRPRPSCSRGRSPRHRRSAAARGRAPAASAARQAAASVRTTRRTALPEVRPGGGGRPALLHAARYHNAPGALITSPVASVRA